MRVLERGGVENPVIEFAASIRIPHTKLRSKGRRGIPDDIFWIPGGKPLLVEFKSPDGELSDLQILTIKELRGLGYDVEVIDSVPAGIQAITRAVEAAKLSGQSRQVAGKSSVRRSIPKPKSR